ncbi:MAG: hypothetical protein ACKVQR_04295 [Aquabacterium sp.]
MVDRILTPDGTTHPVIAQQAQLALAELAIAARTGQITAAAVLAYVERIGKHLVQLAEYEAACDETAASHWDMVRAIQAAEATGKLARFPTRQRHSPGGNTGGHAA